jgi:ABC-type uncharacterized transport system permease subunit
VITATKAGAFFAAVLALVWIVFGFWPFFFVAIAMIVGGIAGRIVDGKLDVRMLADAVRGRRSSS